MFRLYSSLQKRFVAIFIAAFVVFTFYGVEVSRDQAQTAVNNWLCSDPALGCRIGNTAKEVKTLQTSNGVQFHVVKIDGGGFVVTSADTELEPIVAFSSSNDMVDSADNPFLSLLRRDMDIRSAILSSGKGRLRMQNSATSPSGGSNVSSANEMKWSKLLNSRNRLRSTSGDGVASVSDIRVSPIIGSRWGQEGVGNDTCFNRYTPKNYPCGCVATAGAQIMRHFMWPTASMTTPSFTNPYCKVDGVTTSLTTKGGSYDWNNMPLVPDSSITVEQREAIGKLTSDIGICCGMSYASDGGSTGGYMLAEALTNHFGYANAIAVEWGITADQSKSDELGRAMLSNFDAGLPVTLGIHGEGVGHVIIGDGYGYSDGDLFIHMR